MHFKFHLIIMVVMAGMLSCTSSPNIPRAKNGSLDLSDWSWEEQGEVALEGEWSFYWKVFILPSSSQATDPPQSLVTKVPGRWRLSTHQDQSLSGTGYATYRLKVQLPANSPPLSLRVNTASTAMRIWVNGESVYEVGQVATSAKEAAPGFNPGIVSLPPVSSLDIIIHLSNYHYRDGGLWDSIRLGPTAVITKHWIRDYAITFFLIGSFIIMALYHLILYFHRRSAPSSLYFSIFCLLIVLRTLSTELYLIAALLPWGWTVRVELLSFYLCVPVFAAFARAIFPTAIPHRLVRISVYTTAVFSLIVLFLPVRWSSYTVIPFEIFAVGISTVGFYKILTSRWYQLDGIVIFLLGFICVFITLINDSLYANNIINTFFMAPFGLFFFLFSQAILLSRRFSRLANALERSNTQLGRQNRQIEEKNEALIKLNQEMDVFVYRTSHDLRAPLTSLLGIINLIRSEKISSSIASYLDLQERSIHKLDNFIREILDYSRNSRLELTPQTVDFRTLIEETYSLYTHLLQYDIIDKQTSIHQTTPFTGDIKRLEVIFNNLISNALRYYNPYQARPYIRIDVQVSESEVSLRVEDNGVGIASKHLDRIFDMFYRASVQHEGSGLGLFLVKETVEKMQGSVRVQSVVNEGTAFTINIPNQPVPSMVETS